jgi:hypothetical protein
MATIDPRESKDTTLVCVECEAESSGRAERWRAYLDTANALVFYCPRCSVRVFDCDTEP